MCHNVSTTIAVAGSLVLAMNCSFFCYCTHCSLPIVQPLLLLSPSPFAACCAVVLPTSLLLFAAITIVSAAHRLLLCCYVVAALFQSLLWLLPVLLPLLDCHRLTPCTTCSQTCFATAVFAVYTFLCSMDHDLSSSVITITAS